MNKRSSKTMVRALKAVARMPKNSGDVPRDFKAYLSGEFTPVYVNTGRYKRPAGPAR